MSIDIPQLDETAYESLLDRTRNHISAYSDEWTDLNPHDPGITILEVLAWLTETHSYQLDQITDTHREKYLRLLGETPTPPQPASVRLDLSPAGGQTGRLPAGTRLTVDDGSGTNKQFETDRPTTVTDTTVTAVVVDDGQEIEKQTNANETDEMFYRAFGETPSSGSALALGFDSDPFESTDELSLFVDFHDADLPDPPATERSVDFEPSVNLVWEYCRTYRPHGGSTWEPLAVVNETTNSFYETGFVRLERPQPWQPKAWGTADNGLYGHEPGLVWLRCRVETGGYEIPPQLNSVELNVVDATHRQQRTAALEPSDETPAELAPRTYQFDHAPILSATVWVDGEQWTEIEDFDASGPTDTHYVLDRAAGELTFGDEQTGSRPPVDTAVTASYVSGGGTEGNVSATSNWWFSEGDQPLGDGCLRQVEVTPRGPATGGRDAESIDAAIDRVRRDLRTTARTVTKSDYTTVAERTPGVRIARSTVCLQTNDQGAHRETTVVVVPYAPSDIRRPYPSDGFRDAVDQQLDRHRLLADRVRVVPPTYVGLEIDVSVTVSDRYLGDGHRSAIETGLEAYIDPIGGFEGDGWPFGRAVSSTELADQLTTLEAVDHVEELSLHAVGDAVVTTDDTVLIDDQTLFYIETVEIDATVGQSRSQSPAAIGGQ